MAIYRVLQDHVVTEAEFRLLPPASPAPVALSQGRTLILRSAAPGAPAFTPVGPGMPLTVVIRHVYTGRYPKKTLFGGASDVAVVSGVKNFDVFDASTRALNLIATGQSSHGHLAAGAAWSQGTPVVLYSPAVLADSITLSLELAIAAFEQPLLDKVSSALGGLAGVPLLLPCQGYLLAASQVNKLAGDIGHALFDGPAFSVTDSLNFDLPGAALAVADFRVLCGAGLQADAYRYVDGRGLVDAQGAPYAGDEPYFVVSLDGKPNDALKSFAPTVAGAAVLQRFFDMKDGAEAGIDTVLAGLKLVSDLTYRDQAGVLAAKIAAAPAGPDRDALVARRDAVLKNIGSDALRPGASS